MRLINSYRFVSGFDQQGKYTEAQIDDLITNQSYIPVAIASEFNNMSTTINQTMGVGSPWEGTYLTGRDKKYVQIYHLDFTSLPNIQTSSWQGVYDGNKTNCNNVYLSTFNGLFSMQNGSGSRIIRNVIIDGISISEQQGSALLGGIIDGAYTIEDCEVHGSITQTGTNGRIGGMAGDFRNGGTMERCKSTVTVSGGNGLYYGSLIGLCRANLNDCYATGSVNATGTHVGGLCGRVSGGTFAYNYSYGSVSGGGSVGGLVGSTTTVATASYWDTVTSGQASSASGTGKTTTEMQQGSIPDITIYIGWDPLVWDPVDNTSYPILI